MTRSHDVTSAATLSIYTIYLWTVRGYMNYSAAWGSALPPPLPLPSGRWSEDAPNWVLTLPSPASILPTIQTAILSPSPVDLVNLWPWWLINPPPPPPNADLPGPRNCRLTEHLSQWSRDVSSMGTSTMLVLNSTLNWGTGPLSTIVSLSRVANTILHRCRHSAFVQLYVLPLVTPTLRTAHCCLVSARIDPSSFSFTTFNLISCSSQLLPHLID